MVFDAARGRVEDLDDDDFLEADSDENPSTPREPVRPATPKRSGGSGRKKKERSLPPRKLGALTKTHWEKSKAEQTAIDAAFAALDRDGDGSLLPQDIIEATQELGLHFRRPDIYQLVGEHDADGEGRLQAGEFRGIMIEGVRDADTAEDYDLLWAEFDRDGAGYVDVAALRTFFSELGEDVASGKIDVEKMITEAKQGRDAGTAAERRVSKEELRVLLEAASSNARSASRRDLQ